MQYFQWVPARRTPHQRVITQPRPKADVASRRRLRPNFGARLSDRSVANIIKVRVARRPKPDVWTSFTTRTVEAAMALFPGFLES